MKKYLYGIFTMMLTAWALMSCVDEIEITPPDDSNSNSGTGNQMSLSFKIPFEGLEAKAESDNYADIGEMLIDGVRIVFYGSAYDNTMQYYCDYDIKFIYDISTSSFKVSGSDLLSFDFKSSDKSYFIQTKARKMSRGDYRMLIIVNPNDKIKTLTSAGYTLNSLGEPFDTMDEHSMYRTWNTLSEEGEIPAYFMMLNAHDLIPVAKSNYYATAELAEENPVFGTVERVAAKVSCSHIGSGSGNLRSTLEAGDGRFVMYLGYDISGDYDLPDWVVHCIYNSGPWACGGTYDRTTKICDECGIKYGFGLGQMTDIPRYIVATDLMWQVDIVNKKSYWYRHPTLKADKTQEKYEDTDIQNFYAEDPNFSGFSGKTGLADEFLYKTTVSYTNGKGDSFRRLTPAGYTYSAYWSWQEGDNAPVYIPENTMAQEEQKGDVVTRVIVKAQLKRERFDTPENTFLIGDFFLFTGGVTGSDSKYNMNNVDPNGNHFYLLPAEDVVKYRNDPTTTIPVNLREGDISLTAALEQFDTDNASFKWGNLEEQGPAISEHLVFYKNGEMYYEIPIKHFSQEVNGVEAGGYGRFGVVRNRGYQLNIVEVMSLGTPTIPTPATNLIEVPEVRSKSYGILRVD